MARRSYKTNKHPAQPVAVVAALLLSFSYLRQLLHQVVEALVGLPQKSVSWESHVFKKQLRRVLGRANTDADGALSAAPQDSRTATSRRRRYLGLQTNLLQLASFVEALRALLHQEQADAVGRRLGLAVGHSDDQHEIGQPAVGDEDLHPGERLPEAEARDPGPRRPCSSVPRDPPKVLRNTLLPLRIQSLPSRSA